MVQFLQREDPQLSRTFAALADPTRRKIVERLSGEDATITNLAETFAISLTGARKHVRVLEDAELVRSAKVGRSRRCTLADRQLVDVRAWMDAYGRVLDERLGRLDEFLTETKGEQL